jgi:ribokinase
VLRGDVRPRFGQVEQLLDDGLLVLGSSAGIAASGLARLGITTALAAVVGDDVLGRFSREQLDIRGVDSSFVRVSPGQSTGLTVILSEPDDRAILTAVGALRGLTDDDVLAAAAGREHVHFASPYLLPHLLPRIPDVLRELRGQGIGTSIDTNWDPAERWDRLDEILPLVDIYLPNLHELRAAGRSLGIAEDDDRLLTAAIASRGPDVVVKAGADGGWSASADGSTEEVVAERVEVVDTTGAGDSFDAGYLAARLEGQTPRERLRWAVAAGSLSTRGSGGTDAQASRDEVLAARPS